jgi:hypothetical protein
MKKCIAYTPIAGSRSAWLPCLRAVEVGERFCRRHGDAITGAVFGALMYGPVVDEEVKIVEDRVLPRYARETVKKKRRKKNSNSSV